MLRGTLKLLALLALALVLLIGGTLAYIFGPNQAPRGGPTLGPSVTQVADGIATVYLFELAHGGLALIDAGNDPSGAPILAALRQRNKTVDDVAAIFITHAHSDHIAAVAQFPRAEVYALQAEADLAAGHEAYGSPIGHLAGETNSRPFRVSQPLQDAQTVSVDDLQITAYAVPGHTPGSAMYLARGILFLGDAASIGRNKQLRDPVWLFSRDTAQGVASLAQAIRRLTPQIDQIHFIAASHSGVLADAEAKAALQAFVRRADASVASAQ